MPIAYPFSTLGKLNGLPGCVPKVDVSNFDYWITASGYSKEDFDASTEVTQEQIDQSLHKIGRLFWNLYRLEVGTYDPQYDPDQLVTEVVIKGDGVDAIQPKERVCSGSLSQEGVQFFNARADLRLLSGFARLYKGDTTDEANFIGYSLSEAFKVTTDPSELNPFISPIDTYLSEGIAADFYVGLGGFLTEPTTTISRTYYNNYIKIDGVHVVFFGYVANINAGETPQFIDNPPTARYVGFDFKAEITSLEMWEY